MFGHIFVNRMKILLRDGGDVFWTIIFPVVLAVFYALAFANLMSADNFKPFPIAVVDNGEYRSKTYFAEALGAVSDGSATEAEQLFSVQLMTKDQADESLQNGAVEGYILFDGGARVVVKTSGLDQTILKNFVDSFLQHESAVRTILKENPSAAARVLTGDTGSYVKQAGNDKVNGNSTVIMYFGLISMAVMFGSFWGRREVEDIQADMSVQGARLNLAPVHKMKAFLSSLTASLLIQTVSLFILVGFMAFVLGVDFGPRLGYILLTCVIGGIMGVTFGAFLTAVIRGNANLRFAVMLTVSLLSSTLAGMVTPSLKYAVTQAVPALQYVNPANLVSDAFYALYYYGAGARYALNIILMLAFSAVFSVIVWLAARRQKYASL